ELVSLRVSPVAGPGATTPAGPAEPGLDRERGGVEARRGAERDVVVDAVEGQGRRDDGDGILAEAPIRGAVGRRHLDRYGVARVAVAGGTQVQGVGRGGGVRGRTNRRHGVLPRGD